MDAIPPTPARAIPPDDFPPDGRRRVIVENVQPAVDSGRFPVKRVVRETIEVSADVFADGHDVVCAALRVRTPFRESFEEPMAPLGNDRFAIAFTPERLGRYEYTVVGWLDGDRSEDTVHFPLLLDVDREIAAFGAWYEMFPRSASAESGRSGTFADVEKRLPYLAGMGFDVLYLPPIHPIGRSHRKGRNNAVIARPDDVGSVWAIGGAEGGHKSIDASLGTLDDFRHLVKAADAHGLEIALDIAFQCSPDHPYAKEHPEWFRRRPDGSIQCAENPPKIYEDIYPFDFSTSEWRSLWLELRSVFDFWIDQGVKIFRVDNPHTKAFPFWEWCVAGLRSDHPDVVLLSEAFTRPRVMQRLAKLGFNQSYTYFAWRNSAWELREYFEELVGTDVVEYLRPNVWPNTPDILTAYLQENDRPAFVIRAVLAATLASTYGVYGPVFELAEGRAREPGSEEYLDSEKYEVLHWDLDQPHSLSPLLTRLNSIRRSHAAFHTNRTLQFHDTDNEALLCYSKRDPATGAAVLCVVNVDPRLSHDGNVHLDLDELGLAHDDEFVVRDLLGGASYTWRGAHSWVRLDPQTLPAHVFAIEPA